MKQRIDRNDAKRALLTETTPYELPLTINNSGFYLNLKNEKLKKDLNALFNFGDSHKTIPLKYKIAKDKTSLRGLALPHPTAQLQFCELYNKYDSLMLFLCRKSNFSLRHPSKTASYFYKNRETKALGIEAIQLSELDDPTDSAHQEHASSYFAYRKYNLLYKFYKSFEYQSLEKRFSHLLRFDISKCFDSIYTHTIAWAVKNKTYAKANGGYSFENRFDQIIRNANHGETNGIIIGPEFSRIFAEIILQRIDCDANIKLKDLIERDQFAVRRYVDDYFVFSSHPDISKLVFDIFKIELEKHKLHINESKTELYSAPFITPISVAKNEISERFKTIFDYIIPNDEPNSNIEEKKKVRLSTPSKLAYKMINSIKEVIHNNKIDFHSVAGHALSIVNRQLESKLQLLKEQKDEESIFKVLFAVLELSFFVANMAPRVRSIYLITKTCVLSIDACTMLSYDKRNNIYKKIHDECLIVINKICRSQQYEKTNSVEFSNLLICASLLGEDYLYSERTLEEAITNYLPKDPTETLGYFEITSLLFYIRDRKSHEKLRHYLFNILIEKIEVLDPSLHSESAHLLLDSISCPFLSLPQKDEILNVAFLHKDIAKEPNEIRRLVKSIGSSDWFFTWNGKSKILDLLEKKSLKNIY